MSFRGSRTTEAFYKQRDCRALWLAMTGIRGDCPTQLLCVLIFSRNDELQLSASLEDDGDSLDKNSLEDLKGVLKCVRLYTIEVYYEYSEIKYNPS